MNKSGLALQASMRELLKDANRIVAYDYTVLAGTQGKNGHEK